MPVEIDERWEYWCPSEEIAEAVGDGRSVGFGGLPRSKCGRTGRFVADGFRFGKGSPDSDPTRLAPPRFERPDRLPLRRCRHCSRFFTPTRKDHVYCEFRCSADGRVLPPKPCERCGVEFKPDSSARRFCSTACHAATTAGVPRRLDWGRIACLYQSGRRVCEIVREVRARRPAIIRALKAQGVYRGRGKSGTPRTLPDVPCLTCGKVFRVRRSDAAGYCSKKCYGKNQKLDPKSCEQCGVTFQPHYSQVRFCSNRCHLDNMAALRAVQPRPCKCCGVVFTPKVNARVACSIRCGQRLSLEARLIDAAEVLRLRAMGYGSKRIANIMGRSASGVRGVLQQHEGSK